MSRYAEDLIPMLKILLEPTLTIDLKLDIPVNLRNIKLYYMKDDGGNPIVSPVNNELIEAQKNVVKTWNDMFGVKAKELNLKRMIYSPLIWSNKLGEYKAVKYVFTFSIYLRSPVVPSQVS